jgi:hypothetical protein
VTPADARRAAEAFVARALAECNRLGVHWEDFLNAVLAEEKLHPELSEPRLYERAFRRLEATRN